METIRSITPKLQANPSLAAAGLVVLGSATLYLLRVYFSGGVCRNKNRLDSKTVIITGANTGIGKETAIELAKRGARVVMACRSPQRGQEALKDAKDRSGSKDIVLMKLDLSSKRSIKEFAEDFLAREKELHILINNAGVMHTPYQKTEDGFEKQIGTNHFGHFYLTHLLTERLKECAPSRIINVASIAHVTHKLDFSDLNFERKPYDTYAAYGNSKAANMLHAYELSQRLKDVGVTAYSLHPGAVNTELTREYGFLAKVSPNKQVHSMYLYILTVFVFMHVQVCFLPLKWIGFKTSWQGAQTTIYLATEKGVEKDSGWYFADCTKKTPWKGLLKDPEKARKLWDITVETLKIKDD